MKKKDKLLSLILAILMLIGAAIVGNKSVFGCKVEKERIASAQTESDIDTVSTLPDGRVVIHTSGIPRTISGYAGPVELDIYLKNNKITEVKPLPNAETPSFFQNASELLPLWVGKTPSEALEMKVDAVSGATFSSQAIINNVNVGLAYYEGIRANDSRSTPWKIWIALAVTLVACVVPLFVKNKIYHTIQLLANVVVLGAWCGQFLDYTLILKYISDGIMFPVGLVAVAMLVVAFIYPIFGHPQHYCNHICPLGSLQQLAGELCGHKIRISQKMLKGLDWFRKILWAVLMLLLWTDSFSEWMDWELFQAFQFESASWWIIGSALFFVILSVVVTRPYCRFVCPTGSLFKRAENIG